MQAISQPLTVPEVDENVIQHFTLEFVLPEGYALAFNTEIGILSLINDVPRILMQQSFSQSEVGIIVPLIASFPFHAPYEMLYASYHKGNTQDKTVERARKHLERAAQEGQWDSELKPIRNNLSRARFKLHSFGLDVKSILDTGYILQVARRKLGETGGGD